MQWDRQENGIIGPKKKPRKKELAVIGCSWQPWRYT